MIRGQRDRFMFVPLHAKSGYSLGYGVVDPRDLVGRAAALGYGAVALTDVENLYGQVRFHEAARAARIKPITGIELASSSGKTDLFAGPAGRLILLVRDEEGFGNLCRIVSRRRMGSVNVSESPVVSVAPYSSGLFILTDSIPLLEAFRTSSVPADAVRGLLVRPADGRSDEADLIRFCGRYGIRTVADLDVVLAAPEDLELHELRVAAARGVTIETVRHRRLAASARRCLLDPREVEVLFADTPDALVEAARIADACIFDLRGSSVRKPMPELTRSQNPVEVLRRRCEDSLAKCAKRAPDGMPSYRSRLTRELETIERLELGGYFLLVAEIAHAARERRIGVAARGSAVSSLVVYLLGVSAVDPIAEGLVFERFLNALRPDVPDVDLDVDSVRRDELIGLVRARFGSNRTATVGSMHAIQTRTAYREALPALGMPPRQARAFSRRIRDSADGAPSPEVPTEFLPGPFREHMSLIERLIGIPHHFSAHPGGLVITGSPLDSLVPLERTDTGATVTQFDRDGIRSRGLVKIDLLGNRTLSEFATVTALSAGTGAPAPDWSHIPPDDAPTLSLINGGETLGCFQVESPAVRSVLRRLPVSTIRDVTVALALVRPGAASGDAKASYVRRARGVESIDTRRPPQLRAVLRESQGIMLFEEDVIRVIAAAGDLGFDEADRVRAAIVDPGEHRDNAATKQFRKQSEGTIGERDTQLLWQDLEKFAAFSFSRAHAASYARLAYASAFMKVHYPAAFTCALIEHHGGMYPLRAVVAEMMRRGVQLLGPDVNRSGSASALEGGGARVGLSSIKHVGRDTLGRILLVREERAFSSLDDLIIRARPSVRELEALVLCGACDELPPLTYDGYPEVHERVLRAVGRGTASFRGAAPQLRGEPPIHDEEDLRVYRSLVRIRNELHFLSMHVHAHPMQILRGAAKALGMRTTRSASKLAGDSIDVAGVVSAARIVPTEDGPMQYFTLEDEFGTLECVAYPAVYRGVARRIATPGPYIIHGTLRIAMEDPHLEVESIRPFHERTSGHAAAPRSHRHRKK